MLQTLDQETGAFSRGFTDAYWTGKYSTMSMSSFKTFMKCLQSKISLKSLKYIRDIILWKKGLLQEITLHVPLKPHQKFYLGSVQNESWSREGMTSVAFSIFVTATISHICKSMKFLRISKYK